MKIKDVIEQTGLTDKAIRLYINNGLAAPSIEENYSGRKSIDFSDADIERLKNVALLRKAGFSIGEIKAFLEDENNINEIVSKFIDAKEKDIQRDTEIVNTLSKMIKEKLTFEKLCMSLNGTSEEKEVPEEDMHLSRSEKALKIISVVFAFLGLTASVGMVLYFWYINISTHKYFQLEEGWLIANLRAYGGLFVIAVLSAGLLCLCFAKKIVKRKILLQSVSIGLILLLVGPMLFVAFWETFGGAVDETTSSTTTDIYDYGDFDGWAREIIAFTDADKVLPYVVPDVAEDAEYYYCHSIGGGDDFQSSYANLQLYAEWTLPEEEYEQEKLAKTKDKYKTVMQYGVDGGKETTVKVEPVRKGEWTCYFFEEEMTRVENVGDTYLYIIFAHNDETRRVRYVLCYAAIADVRPYCYSLEW